MTKKGHTVAVTGKGGTGKTVISSTIIRLLSQDNNHSILGIDADPAMSLGSALGLRIGKTLGDVREDIYKDTLKPTPSNVPLDVMIENQLREILVESPEFQFLAMGRPEGPGCYCLINDMMRHVLDRVSKKYDFTVIDCEAGLEHISRRTIRNIDYLFIVTDPTTRGMETARTVERLAQELEVKSGKACLIVNKVTEEDQGFCQGLSKEIAGIVPLDPNVTKYDREGEPILFLPDDSPAVVAVNEIISNTLLQTLLRR